MKTSYLNSANNTKFSSQPSRTIGLFLMVLFVFILPLVSFGQITQIFNTPGTSNFTVPAGVTSITVQAWGAGGGGGGSTNAGGGQARGGGGGGGGAYASSLLTVTAGTTLTINVGSGGLGFTGNNGNDGGNSSISTFAIEAVGGKGGIGNTSGGSPSGGAGGSIASSTGTTKTPGTPGTNGATGNGISSGSGGNAANSGGIGGAGISTNGASNNGNNGSAPGGGGGGGRTSQNVGNFAGGNGGNGQVIITYTPAYQAQIISANTGSVSWCSGETRTVSVTIKNTGTQPWTDGGGKNFNIGVKWNTNGTSWPDYNVRVDAQNLAPGASATYNLPITASNNISGAYTTPLAAGTNNLTFDVVYEAVSWFGNNNNGVGPGNIVFTTVNQTINAASALAFTSGNQNQTVCPGSAITNTVYTFSGSATGATITGLPAGLSSAINVGAKTVTISGTPTASGTYTISTTGHTTPCSAATINGVVTVTVPAGDQTSFGNSSWIGYVYANTNGGNPPSNAFTTNYQGYITQTETFDYDLGAGSISGANLCNTYADNFAVRYKMNKNMPAGNYTFNVGGDDGYFLYINGALTTINNWSNHVYLSSTQTVYLSGNTNFILEYFETGGDSRVQFSYTFCPVYSLTGVSAVATTCTTAKTSIVTLTSTAAGMPIGTYTVTYSLSYNGNSTPYTAPMTVTAAGKGQFTANLGIMGTNNSTTIRIDNLALGSCNNAISSGNVSNTVNMYAPITPIAYVGFASCSTWNAQWNNDTFVSGYFLDVATTSSFNAGSYVAGFQNLNVGNVITYPITGLTTGNTYYYRVRNNNLGCGVSVNSNVVSFVATGSTAPTISTITQPTCSTSTGSFTITNYVSWHTYIVSPSIGVTISGSTVAAPSGNYTITDTNSGCTSAITNFTINAQPATPIITIQPVTPTVCENTSGSLTVATSAPSPTYQWQYASSIAGTYININIDNTIANVTGHTTNTLTSTDVTVAYSGNYVRCVVTSGGCSVTSNSVLLTVNPLPAKPTIGTITQPNCLTASGSVVLNGLPSSGTWAITRSPGGITTTGTGTSTTISGLSTGTYTYRVDIANNGTGLKGEYFNNMFLTGPPVLTRTDATINGTWGAGSPDPLINNDNFSVRWTGQVQPLYSETYTFSTFSDDGIRLWVNGINIIDQWNDHGGTTHTGNITLTAGVKYSIVLEFYENGGAAVSQLSWSSPSQVFQIIPQTQLFTVAGCSSLSSENVVINSQPLTPVAPIVGTITQPTCVAAGSVVLSGLPAGSWTINATPITSGLTGNIGSTVTTTVGGLTAGTTYTFTVTNSVGCTSIASTNAAVPAVLTTTYNGSIWSSPPDINKIGTITGSGTLSINTDLCNCTVNTGISAVVASGVTLKLQDKLTVNGTGTLTFENTASLVQVNDNAANTGNIIYKRITPSLIETDYTYWSSPVTGQTLNISPDYAYGTFYSFDSTIDNWKDANLTTPMVAGNGYIIRGQRANNNSYSITATFTGIPTNGITSVTVNSASKALLLGNPYPSALDADTFIANNSAVIKGTLYFWTHYTSIRLASSLPSGTAGTGVYAYTSNDYASYNLTGGVGTGKKADNDLSTTPIIPNGKIAAGQGFFAEVQTGGGTVNFKNYMRVGVGSLTGNNTQFFKTKNPQAKTTNVIEKNRVWLNLTNTQGAFKQTLIGYVTGATNEIDYAYDGETFDGQEFIDFYSINQNKNLTIQGRALPFDEYDEVPLGFRSTIEGSFAINIDEVDGSMTNQDVFLEDKLTNTTTNLKTGNYTFNTVTGTFNDRFVLKYKPSDKTLGNADFDAKANRVLVSVKNKQIKINSFSETISKVTIFDLLGRQIYKKDKVNSNEFLTTDFSASQQSLIVKTTLQNGKMVTDKIIF